MPGTIGPAGEIERFVVDQIHQIGTDPQLITETIRQVRLQSEGGITRMTAERTSLQHQLRTHHADLQATASLASTTKQVSQLADLQDHLRTTERRLTEIDNELTTLRANQIDEAEVTQAVRIKSRSLHCPCGGWVGYMGGDRVKDLAVSFSARMRHRHGWFCSEVVV